MYCFPDLGLVGFSGVCRYGLERFYIHTEYTAYNHLNDSQYIFPNAIFDTILATHLQQ